MPSENQTKKEQKSKEGNFLARNLRSGTITVEKSGSMSLNTSKITQDDIKNRIKESVWGSKASRKKAS